jgi:DNA-binding MarR family transcriptional regulator
MKISDELKKKYIDNKDAETISEIANATGLSEATIVRHAKKMLDNGNWKEVTKKQGNRFVKAYIKAK